MLKATSRTKERNRILKTFKLSSSQDRAAGLNWYKDANEQAQAISKGLGVNLNTTIGVIAALSPTNKWRRNLSDAAALIKAFTSGDSFESVKVSTYNTMKAKAWSILADRLTESDCILKRLNGQKIKSFFECIAGFDGSCCIDGHAINIAYGKRVNLQDALTSIGRRDYKLLQESYHRAAKAVGLKAFEMQAITWVTWRRVHGIH